MKKFILTIAAALVATVGFAQSKTIVEFEDTQARMLNVESNAIFKPLVVEIEMMANVGKVVEKVPFTRAKMESFKGDVASLRSWATFQVTDKCGADVLVAATYDVYYNSNDEGGYVTVVGFPAKFKNWHSVTNEDLEWIRVTSASREANKTELEKTNPVRK